MGLSSILTVLFFHWIGDFVCQTNEMAQKKSSSNYFLFLHVSIYTAIISIGALLVFSPLVAVAYGISNGVFHFAIDYFTSRWTKKLYAKGDVHNFFVVIGLDQLMHTALLILFLV